MPFSGGTDGSSLVLFWIRARGTDETEDPPRSRFLKNGMSAAQRVFCMERLLAVMPRNWVAGHFGAPHGRLKWGRFSCFGRGVALGGDEGAHISCTCRKNMASRKRFWFFGRLSVPNHLASDSCSAQNSYCGSPDFHLHLELQADLDKNGVIWNSLASAFPVTGIKFSSFCT